ncbi:long-chain-fatty-acid--CoA ligase [Bradyrhizobium macuxiense]|nr:long-chain-fatty-acid--CoA ligase [Bradyrhizobium macuxiense]
MRITSLLRRCLQTGPDSTATVFRGRETNWRDTYEEIQKGGGAMQRLGATPGDRVAALALNSDVLFRALFAIPWVGAVVVPLNTRWSVPELSRALEDCDTTILLVDENFLNEASRLKASNERLKVVYIGAGECPSGFLDYRRLVAAASPVPEHQGSGDELFCVLYTGGTTGHPKGVMLSHTNLFVASQFWLSTCHFSSETKYLHIAGFFHIVATVPAIAVMMVGGSHVIEPKFDPVPTMRAIQESKANFATFVPVMINMMLQHPDFDRYDLTSMRQCVYGGSPIPDALIDRMIEKLPTWQFIQGYGQTESSGILTNLPWHSHFGQGSACKRKATGLPVYGVNLKIVDPEGKEVEPNEQGEIVVCGLNVMRGYWGNEEATKATIRDGWLHTGDAARMDNEGFITVVDRIKDMIVTGGENVFSIEVENAVAAHPAVSQCAVIGVPHPKWGESVHAVVVLRAMMSATEEELIDHCRPLIANYKCPRSVEFVSEMPMSAAGKIVKGPLRERHWRNQPRRVS